MDLFQPSAGIVLPVWNDPYLPLAVDSILAQTHTRWRLVIVDDGSDPPVSLPASDPRIQLLRIPHAGLPAALNAGFRALPPSDFVTWTSADNLLEPSMLQVLIRFLIHHPAVDLTYSDFSLIGPTGQWLPRSNYRPESQDPRRSHRLHLPRCPETLGLMQDNFFGASFLYRTGLVAAVGDFDESLMGVEDYDYWLRASLAGRLAHCEHPQSLYRYRLHPESLTSQRSAEIAQRAEALVRRHRQRVDQWARPCQLNVVRHPRAEVLATEWEKSGHRIHWLDPQQPDPRSGIYLDLAAAPLSHSAPVRPYQILDLAAPPDFAAAELLRRAVNHRFPMPGWPSQPTLVVPLSQGLDPALLTEILHQMPAWRAVLVTGPEDPPPPGPWLHHRVHELRDWIAPLSLAQVLIWPHQPTPEFLRAAAFSFALGLWSGRPLLASHAAAALTMHLHPQMHVLSESAEPRHWRAAILRLHRQAPGPDPSATRAFLHRISPAGVAADLLASLRRSTLG
jgi:GT2 family glycosyltransferase